MKYLYEDSDDTIKSSLGLAALAAGIALAANKIYNRKFKDEKLLKKYGDKTEQFEDIETEELLTKENLINQIEDEKAETS